MSRHRLAIIVSLFLISVSVRASDPLAISNLKCEMVVNPKGIDAATPRLSWQSITERRGMKQVAYQLIVASSAEKLAKNEGDLWNSGKINSDQSIHVTYAGKKLRSRQECFWKVKVWSNTNEEVWSGPAMFSMGLLQSMDWKGKWIGLDRAFSWDSVTKFSRLSARYYRKEINATKEIKKATVYISGLGLYELYINGEKIGDQVLAPGPTDYSKTILYNTFDVTPRLQQGKNAVAAILGNGRFFTMRQNYKPHKWHDFGFPRLLMQLEIQYADGTSHIVATDQTWKITADGPIRTNNEYDGEEYDASKELTGWNRTGFDDSKWLRAQIMKAPGGKMKAQMNANMKVMQRIRPAAVYKLADKYILDMGQNMAGWVKLNVKGNRGAKVTMRFAESLQPDGQLYVANLRDAIVTDIYTLKGGDRETWSPRFVYHGFRYVEVSGYPGTPSQNDFVGEVVYDDLVTTGSLETSNRTINQVHKNAWWGISGNYKGMPVDCPQRNERQPWLGDRTMGAYGESFLFDNNALYAKWLDDIRDAQTAAGSIPDVAPNFWYYYKDNMTWPGAFITIADMLHRQYGDKKPIVKHYAAMKKWMTYMKTKYMTTDLIMTKDSYGDWCVPPESPKLIHSRDSARTTDPKVIATAYYYYFLNVLQRFAQLTGNEKDIPAFAAEAIRVRDAFNKKFYNRNTGRYSNNTITANILALAFDMVPAEDRQRVFENITEKIIVENKGHISTGVIGTQWLMRWLTKYGRADIAYKLASNTSYPSWGYMVENGATTIWELWNGNTADPAMNSQNHVMLLGDLLIWMYENLGGIQSDVEAVGFKKTVMRPSLVSEMDYVKASHETPYGAISSHWKKDSDKLDWEVQVPANTTAVVYLPAGSVIDVKEGKKAATAAQGVKFVRMENGYAVFEIGSGKYSFSTTVADKKLTKSNS